MTTTGSEVSSGLGDIISNLRSLRRDLDDETSTETSSVNEEGGGGGGAIGGGGDEERDGARALETGQQLRHRTGK